MYFKIKLVVIEACTSFFGILYIGLVYYTQDGLALGHGASYGAAAGKTAVEEGSSWPPRLELSNYLGAPFKGVL